MAKKTQARAAVAAPPGNETTIEPGVAPAVEAEGNPAPAPAQGNEGQAVAAEGSAPSARHDPDAAGTLTVTGPEKGRWRAGLRFTLAPTVLAVAELTDDQVVAITNDPELAVLHTPPAA